MLILLAIKFASWLYDRPIKDSNVVVNVVTVSSASLGVAKEVKVEDEKEREDGTVKKSSKSKAE